VTRNFNAPKDIGATAPLRGLESTLRDDLRPTLHGVERLGYIGWINSRTVYFGDGKTACFKVVNITLFVPSAALRQKLQYGIPN
jgi:hypothetical protein